MPEKGKRGSTKQYQLQYHPRYAHDYDPAQFRSYKPGKGIDLTYDQIGRATEYVQRVCALDSESAVIYLWRFGFGLSPGIIKEHLQTGKSVNGLCEALRFGCGKYLNLQRSISDNSMRFVFRRVLQDYEILCIHRGKGICWTRSALVECDGLSLRAAAEQARQREIQQLDKPSATARYETLKPYALSRLARLILNLPVDVGGVFLMRFHLRMEYEEIERQCWTEHARGTIAYYRRILSQRLRLAYPVCDSDLEKACGMCMDYLLE